jgi:hypothetical protein
MRERTAEIASSRPPHGTAGKQGGTRNDNQEYRRVREFSSDDKTIAAVVNHPRM